MRTLPIFRLGHYWLVPETIDRHQSWLVCKLSILPHVLNAALTCSQLLGSSSYIELNFARDSILVSAWSLHLIVTGMCKVMNVIYLCSVSNAIHVIRRSSFTDGHDRIP